MLLCITVFYPSLNNAFVHYDDPKYVTGNPHVLKGVTVENIKWALTAHVDSNWFPLTLISHMTDVSIFGLNPRGHHATNLFFHCANTLLVFLLFSFLLKSTTRAFLIAALFSVHPLKVESVAWISERKDVLSAFFFLLSLSAYSLYAGGKRALYYLLAFLAFALSLACKPMGVTLPFLALLLDFWPLKRLAGAKSIINLAIEKLPFMMLSVISSVITLHVQKEGGSISSISLSAASMNAVVSYVKYIYKMFIPLNLCVLYPLPETTEPSTFTAALLVLIVISVVSVLLIKTNPYIFTGWFWYIGMLVPAIGIVQVGVQAMADRYVYMPYTGLFLIAAMVLPYKDEYRKYLTVFYPVLAALVLLSLSFVTVKQIRYWQNSETLFVHAIEVTENNQVMNVNLGLYLAETGRAEAGIEYIKRAIAINPRILQAHINLGTILLFQLKDINGAKEAFVKALEINPLSADALSGLGVAYAYSGRPEQAIEFLEKAVRIAPDMEMARKNLISAYLLKEKMQEIQ
ncbi:MAG: tetratricopeptide repeat protein [Nitrospirae bacterium YQR-1]